MADDEDNPDWWPPSYYPWPKALGVLVVGDIANQVGFVRAKGLNAIDIPRRQIQEAISAGWLRRVSRGLVAGVDVTDWRCSKIAHLRAVRPKGVVALRDAAMIHGLIPFDDTPPPWFAIGRKQRRPQTLPFEVNWLSWQPHRLELGVERVRFRRVWVLVTTPATTIADYFAHRVELAGQAMPMLQAFRASAHWNRDALIEAAHLCRVSALVRTALKELGY